MRTNAKPLSAHKNKVHRQQKGLMIQYRMWRVIPVVRYQDETVRI